MMDNYFAGVDGANNLGSVCRSVTRSFLVHGIDIGVTTDSFILLLPGANVPIFRMITNKLKICSNLNKTVTGPSSDFNTPENRY